MIIKTVRPTHSGGSEQVEKSDFAEQQIGLLNTKAFPSQQEISIHSYLVDGRFNLIEIQFGLHHDR